MTGPAGGPGVDGARLRVLVVDDQPIIRSGFSTILGVEEDIVVVAEAGDGRAAIALAEAHRPEVVVMDVQMPVLDGIAATRAIVSGGLARVLVLTTFDRDDYLFAALDAGASGFLLKNAEAETIVAAVRTVAAGDALLAPEVTRRVIERMTSSPGRGRDAARIEGLTEREREVLALVGGGASNAEIAERLVIGSATVKTHVSNVLAKLGARDRVQAVVIAHQAGLVPPPQG